MKIISEKFLDLKLVLKRCELTKKNFFHQISFIVFRRVRLKKIYSVIFPHLFFTYIYIYISIYIYIYIYLSIYLYIYIYPIVQFDNNCL